MFASLVICCSATWQQSIIELELLPSEAASCIFCSRLNTSSSLRRVKTVEYIQHGHELRRSRGLTELSSFLLLTTVLLVQESLPLGAPATTPCLSISKSSFSLYVTQTNDSFESIRSLTVSEVRFLSSQPRKVLIKPSKEYWIPNLRSRSMSLSTSLVFL